MATAKVKVLVLRAPGINCDEETAYGWELAGAHAERHHVRRLHSAFGAMVTMRCGVG